VNVVKFKIPVIPRTTTKSIRFPNNLIEEIDAAITGTDCTFTAFVVEAVRVALANLKEADTPACKDSAAAEKDA
jgi:hypothetical protein